MKLKDIHTATRNQPFYQEQRLYLEVLGDDGLLPILGAGQHQVNNGDSAQISFVQIIVQSKYQLRIALPCLDWTGLKNSDGGTAIHLSLKCQALRESENEAPSKQ